MQNINDQLPFPVFSDQEVIYEVAYKRVTYGRATTILSSIAIGYLCKRSMIETIAIGAIAAIILAQSTTGHAHLLTPSKKNCVALFNELSCKKKIPRFCIRQSSF